MFMHSHAYVPSILYLVISTVWDFYDFSLSFFLSFPLILVALWHLSVSLFRPETLFVPRHLLFLLLLTPLPLTSSSVMRRPNRTSWRTLHDAAFIRNAKSFCQTSLTLIYPVSFTVGVGSHCVASRSLVPPWSYWSFTPICMDSILQHLILLLAFEVCAS